MIKINIKQKGSNFDFFKSKLKPRDSLLQDIWIGEDTINPDVSERLIEIATSILESMDIDVKVEDIILTGSIAGYNWHDLSDIDLHIVLNFLEIDENIGLVKRMLDQSRINWNKTHDIFIMDKEVELYFQDVNETHESNGIWSLLQDKWLAEPVHLEMNVDLAGVEKKAEAIAKSIEYIENIISDEKYKEANDYASKLKKKISRMRKSGLAEEGIYSPENLAFKMLRNAGWLGRLSNSKIESYDKMMSLSLSESNKTIEEIKDYFNNIQDEDYMKYEGHPLSSIENLMNPDSPAPWDEDYEGIEE
tara:strand:- start:1337 stop:2251 length:915 start_codon:yes stop_codon:yes gene_type:complete